MSNLIVRTITGALFVALIIGSLLFNQYAAIAVFSIFAVLGLMEFYRLFQSHESVQINWISGTITGALVLGTVIATMLTRNPAILFILVVPIVFTLAILELWRQKKNPILNIAILFAGIIYVIVPFSMVIVLLMRDNHIREFYYYANDFIFPSTAIMFILIWTNDTFAYLTGRFFGKKKLFERISPKKTWEGTLGGIAFTILMAYVIGSFVPNHESIEFWVIAACIIAPCSILGDLLESLMKRSLNIKDSGNILPGHGGILDRFDAMLFTVPFFMAWTWIYLYI